jgi:CelD/BcsL family acetyltransferase involved in cellulose biosynthesis
VAPDASHPIQLPPSWSELHADQVGATPFMHPGWARHWWRYYGDGAEPFIIEAAGGIAAFVLRRRGGQRILEPWGIPPGDYWDVLAPPGGREEVAQAAADVLAGRAKEWDAALIRCLPPDSPLGCALSRSGVVGLSRPIPAPAIELPDSFDSYLHSLSKSHRQNLRRHLRRLDDGEVVLRAVTDPAELPLTFDRWREFRRAQWSAAGKVISPEHLSERFTMFMLDVTIELLPWEQVLVWEMSHAGRVVGVYVNFVNSEAFHWFLGGFDPAVASLGLGKIVIAHGIRTSIEAGRHRYDFGRGAEPYKYWYGSRDRMLGGLVVGNHRLRSRLVVAAARALAARR